MKRVFGIGVLLLALTLMPAPRILASGIDLPDNPPQEIDDPNGVPAGGGDDGQQDCQGDPDDIIEGNRDGKGSEGLQGIGDNSEFGQIIWDRTQWLLLWLFEFPL